MTTWTVTGLLDEQSSELLVAAVIPGVHVAADPASHTGELGRFCLTVEADSAEKAEAIACAMAEGDDPEFDDDIVVCFTRGQVNEWAGRRLTGYELSRLHEALPSSSIAEAVSQIAGALGTGDDGDESDKGPERDR